MIVSFSSVFVNGLQQRGVCRIQRQSSGIFLLTGNPTAVKAPGAEISIDPLPRVPRKSMLRRIFLSCRHRRTCESPAKYTSSGVA